MIAIFDEDGGGDVDFQEFVSGLSAFSSKGNKEEKLRFAFKVYDIDRDGFISNGELFIVLKMMVGNNLKDMQLQQIVDKTIMEADRDGDGKISFEEFTSMVENTDVNLNLTLGEFVCVAFRKVWLIWRFRSVLNILDVRRDEYENGWGWRTKCRAYVPKRPAPGRPAPGRYQNESLASRSLRRLGHIFRSGWPTANQWVTDTAWVRVMIL